MRIHWGLAITVGATLAWGSVAGAAGPKIESVRIDGERDGARISIEGAFSDPRYVVRAKDEGRLIVIDVEQAALSKGGVHTTGTSSLIARTITSNTARGARIELALTDEATYHARASQGRIIVRLERESGPKQKPRASSSGRAVENVYLEQKDGRDRVVVSLRGNPDFRVSTRAGAPPRLEVLGAKVDSGTKRRIEARVAR